MGEDGLDGEGVLDGGDNAQPAATARASEDIEGEQQGKCDEARQTLAHVYDWFTEGFDTADLREAQAMLEELS